MLARTQSFHAESHNSLPDPDSFRIKISVLGDPGIGKSALALRYAKKDFVDFYEPTIEEEFEKRINVFGHNIDVYILDTAGQEDFLPLRSRWIHNRDGFIIASSVEDINLEEIVK